MKKKKSEKLKLRRETLHQINLGKAGGAYIGASPTRDFDFTTLPKPACPDCTNSDKSTCIDGDP